MVWESIGGAIVFAVIGYLIGSVMWAIIIARHFRGDDIRNHGSGNAGATNMVRSYGKKLGLAVFLLDMLKPFSAVIVAWALRTYAHTPVFSAAPVQVAGFFTVVGHCYPVFFRFRGGKGAAANAGFFLAINWLLFPLGVIIFGLVVAKTRKVSIGSLVAPLVLIALQIAFAFIPHMNSSVFNHFAQEPTWWVNTICLVLILALVIWKHRSNIKRLKAGTEQSIAGTEKA